MGITSVVSGVLSSIAAPVASVLNSRQETIQLNATVNGKLANKVLDNEATISLSDKEWEHLGKKNENGSWKDEYVTVSVVSILNLIVLGGILTAFGKPQLLEGVTVALTTFNEIGVDIGSILKVTVYAALGIYAFKKVL
tara:strand:- start:17297 stop:17713 length:417 start_codon:yes stop_codon:yes gene_type:complete